jgi:hypothetical protein
MNNMIFGSARFITMTICPALQPWLQDSKRLLFQADPLHFERAYIFFLFFYDDGDNVFTVALKRRWKIRKINLSRGLFDRTLLAQIIERFPVSRGVSRRCIPSVATHHNVRFPHQTLPDKRVR